MVYSCSAPHERQHERYQRDDQETHEQYLRDPRRAGGNATEAEERGDQRNDEKDNGVVKHFDLLERLWRSARTRFHGVFCSHHSCQVMELEIAARTKRLTRRRRARRIPVFATALQLLRDRRETPTGE